MDLIREGLRDVTNEGGTAGDLFKGFPINVAGKTGTAENAHGRDHGWFVAYAPYDKPQIVVVALVEQGSFGACRSNRTRCVSRIFQCTIK